MMILHLQMGIIPFSRSRALYQLITGKQIVLGGNKPGKIYGKLHCASGRRMKPENRVFFKDEQEAAAAGYRPCANCMPIQYKLWKEKQ